MRVRSLAAAEPFTTKDGSTIRELHRSEVQSLAESPLRFLCCCVPAYEHEDTFFAPLD